MNPYYRLLGGPGSPYSLKLRAILRYRRIPHVWIVPNGYIGTEGELARAGKRLLPVLQYPEGDYHADSTPLAYDLERRHPDGRSIVPDDPAAAFVSHLIEDMADEMLSTAMFDMRWDDPVDRQFCATRQLSGWMSPIDATAFADAVSRFVERQTINRAKMVGSDDNRIVLQRLYRAVLDAIERMLETRPYLLGGRPALADFGLFGQLSQCAIDPTASTLMRAVAPRTFQWTQQMDDTSGVEGEWAAPGTWGEAVHALLDAAGRWYLPLLQANAEAGMARQPRFDVPIDGVTWVGTTDRYKLKCLAWLRDEIVALPAPALATLHPLLRAHGCWDVLRPGAAPALAVQPMAPL